MSLRQAKAVALTVSHGARRIARAHLAFDEFMQRAEVELLAGNRIEARLLGPDDDGGEEFDIRAGMTPSVALQ